MSEQITSAAELDALPKALAAYPAASLADCAAK